MKKYHYARLIFFLTALASIYFAPGSAWAQKSQTPAPSTYRAPVESPAFLALLNPKDGQFSKIHVVEKGESLSKIAQKHNVPVYLIQRVNGLSNTSLRVGQKIKIPNFVFSVLVDKSDNQLTLKGDNEILKTYTVSTGTANSTPVGTFQVTDKLVNPTWYKDGKVIPFGAAGHLIGTRWIGLNKKGYGIHGTIEPEKLGQQVTEGCVRMKNEEVEELFGILPKGANVTIVD